ncbi:hypothetical protein SELMODRAFT_450785 [Selaginella moellendorffii]|uniref:Uncharacterized protein GA20ox-1 n=1 Tax=Selaginella moellendorffii TaxID=88036 RepID=D8SFQ1_SELML|nr:hypothetical protein SELMODRAFT_450785 [Selaginella moellendorffii]
MNTSCELESYVWPRGDCSLPEHGKFASQQDVPTIDLAGGSKAKVDEIGRACRQSGFFQVVNHGVDHELVNQVHASARQFFEFPSDTKLRAARSAGNSFGFAGKFAGRFKSKCPWKETFSLQYTPNSNIKDYMIKVYTAEQHEQHARYETYCKAMEKLGRELIELIAQSLELAPDALNSYFDDGFSIFRMNMYPPSEHFPRLLGTGPHTDPCALTILHQDEVGGLQVYNRDETWVTVEPRADAFVISIGDTFQQALCNHRYKSAKHRAVIHATRARHSLVFFINPGLDTVIRPIPELVVKSKVDEEQDRERPCVEFNWGQLLEFTQKHYRTDVHTLDAFESYLRKTSQAA